ncbi:MAG: glycoside hydrolase family 16 protein, partial [Gillisia sp.]
MMKNSFLITFIFAVGFIPSALKAQVIFEDNFNGDHLDMTHWNYEEGDGCPNNCGWGNHELEIYNRDYVKVEDGKLVITAVKKDGKYYSGKINSKDKVEFTYGTIEIKAKIPGGKGIWPALWMLGTNINKVGWPGSGEIDLMEYVGRMKDTIHTTLHSPAYYGSH